MIAVISGVRSQGKSTLALFMTGEGKHSATRPRRWVAEKVIALDPREQFVTDALPYEYVAGESFLSDRVFNEDHRIFVVRPAFSLPQAANDMAEDISIILTEDRSLKLAVILDESGTSSLKQVFSVDPWDRLFRTHPRETTWILMTVHRPIDVPKNVRSLVDWWICFRTNLPEDLDMLRKQCGDRFADDVSQLEPRHWLRFDSIEKDPALQIDGTEYQPADWFVELEEPGVIPSRRNA